MMRTQAPAADRSCSSPSATPRPPRATHVGYHGAGLWSVDFNVERALLHATSAARHTES
jgi:hypothetical protein